MTQLENVQAYNRTFTTAQTIRRAHTMAEKTFFDVDPNLVSQAQAGCAEATVAVLTFYEPRVFDFARKRINRIEDVIDVVSDVQERTLRYLQPDSFQDRGIPIGVLIHRMTRNRIADYYRDPFTKYVVNGYEKDETLDIADDDPKVNPQEEGDRAVLRAQVREEVAKLPREQQRVVLERIVCNRKFKDVAENLGKSVNNTKVLYFKAKRKLQQAMVGDEKV